VDAGKVALTKFPQSGARLATMRKALKTAPIHKGEVHRVLADLDPDVAAAIAKPGNVLKQEALSSWTAERAAADEFLAEKLDDLADIEFSDFVRMRVKTTSGSHRIDKVVGESFTDEAEVLLEKGKKLRVVSAKRISATNVEEDILNGWDIVLEEVK
jgi:hypothetical protein